MWTPKALWGPHCIFTRANKMFRPRDNPIAGEHIQPGGYFPTAFGRPESFEPPGFETPRALRGNYNPGGGDTPLMWPRGALFTPFFPSIPRVGAKPRAVDDTFPRRRTIISPENWRRSSQRGYAILQPGREGISPLGKGELLAPKTAVSSQAPTPRTNIGSTTHTQPSGLGAGMRRSPKRPYGRSPNFVEHPQTNTPVYGARGKTPASQRVTLKRSAEVYINTTPGGGAIWEHTRGEATHRHQHR